MRITGAASITIHHRSSPIISGAVTVAHSIIAKLRKRDRLVASASAGRSSSQERICVDGKSRLMARS
jgi:hypothetical protein